MRLTLEQAILQLQQGKVVGIPTETVYGLAATLNSPQAIGEIFTLKGRPSNNPLIVHMAHKEQIQGFASKLPQDFFKLAEAFWPGPLTLVLPVSKDKIPPNVCAGLPTAAFRVPELLLTRQVIEATGPLVMPSANISGRPSATSADHVEADFGQDFPVLDGNACRQGVESTILYWDVDEAAWIIIRLGALAPEAFLPVLGYVPKVSVGPKNGQQAPLCPGQMYKHYAPQAHLKLIREFTGDENGVVIGFDNRRYPPGCRLISLGSTKDPQGVAQSLYSVLRSLDTHSIEQAWVDIDFPDAGLWLTISERLSKAAGK